MGTYWEQITSFKKNKACDLCKIKLSKSPTSGISMVLKNKSEKIMDQLQLWVDHFLEKNYEGYDSYEIKLHDKNTNIWVTAVTKPSVQKYASFDEFLKIFSRLKPNDFGNVAILSGSMKEIEFRFIKHSNSNSPIWVYFSSDLQNASNQNEFFLTLNLKFPKYKFSPQIGIQLGMGCKECVSKRDENIKFVDDYRWVCLNSECIDNSDPLQLGSYEQCLIHKQLQAINLLHIPSHKMVLIKTANGESELIQTDGFEQSEEYKHEIDVLCNVCFNSITDQRWHCLDWYQDSLIVDLCQNCLQSHDKVHHLVIMERKEDKWDYIGITRIIDTQIDEVYNCLKCNENVTKKGLAVSFKTEVQGLDRLKPKKIESDFLMWVDHFDNLIWTKLEAVYPNGYYSLVEWVNQYDRKNWHDMLSNLSKPELSSIISHLNTLNSNSEFVCSICECKVDSKIWVCLESGCSKTSQIWIICDNHVGAKQLCLTSDNGHKIICMVKGTFLQI